MREAVARCRSCGRFLCRECATEHESQVICSRCLAGRSETKAEKKTGEVLKSVAALLAGLTIAWFFFYCCGQVLLSMPASFHEGTMWSAKWIDQE